MLGVYVEEGWRFVKALERETWMSVACRRRNGEDKALDSKEENIKYGGLGNNEGIGGVGILVKE